MDSVYIRSTSVVHNIDSETSGGGEGAASTLSHHGTSE